MLALKYWGHLQMGQLHAVTPPSWAWSTKAFSGVMPWAVQGWLCPSPFLGCCGWLLPPFGALQGAARNGLGSRGMLKAPCLCWQQLGDLKLLLFA